MNLVSACAKQTDTKQEIVIAKISARSLLRNRRDRVTGDAICNVGDKILRSRKHLERHDMFTVISAFINDQIMLPNDKTGGLENAMIPITKMTTKTETILKALGKVVRDMRHGL